MPSINYSTSELHYDAIAGRERPSAYVLASRWDAGISTEMAVHIIDTLSLVKRCLRAGAMLHLLGLLQLIDRQLLRQVAG